MKNSFSGTPFLYTLNLTAAALVSYRRCRIAELQLGKKEYGKQNRAENKKFIEYDFKNQPCTSPQHQVNNKPNNIQHSQND